MVQKLDSFDIQVSITIRPPQQDDLPKLEWFGMMTPFRQIIQQDFARFQSGEMVFLVAEANCFPIGQVTVDLVRLKQQNIGYVMSLRVLPDWHRQGIGTRLMLAVEQSVSSHGLSIVRLNVEQDNVSAKQLYERLGYSVIGEECEPWQYTTPDGRIQTIEESEWVMQKTIKGR